MENLVKKNIVFIHGNSCSSEYFKYQKKSNLFKNFNLHFIDLVGHGLSDCSKNILDYSIQSQAMHVYNYIQKNNLENVVLVGHSLGGHIAIRTKAIDHEDLIFGLLIYGTTPFDLNQKIDLAFQSNEDIGLLFKGEWNENETTRIGKLLFSEIENQDDEKLLLQILEKSSGFARTSLFENINTQLAFDEINYLSHLQSSFRILNLQRDLVINKNYFEILPAKFDILNVNASHSPHIEIPEQFNELLIDFLNNIEWNEINEYKIRESEFFSNI